MVKAMVDYFARTDGGKTNRINIIPGWVEPADMREIKSLAHRLGIEITLFPDTSDVLDAPMTGTFSFYPKGGTTIAALEGTGSALATVSLGPDTSLAAARALDGKCSVPYHSLDLPIGLSATDRLVDTLRLLAGTKVPESVTDERGRLLDMIADMQQYTCGKRVALWGDPDQLVSLSEFLLTLDKKPVYIVTGTPGKKFEGRIAKVLGSSVPEAKVRQGGQADMLLMHQWIKEEPVDLLIGNTYGKYIARDEDIPFIRHGFPILDRVGHQAFPTVGYRGAMRLLEKILDAFLDRQDRDAPEESFELVM